MEQYFTPEQLAVPWSAITTVPSPAGSDADTLHATGTVMLLPGAKAAISVGQLLLR